MNKLNQEQIDQLFAFTKKHLVEYYDVQVELVDHLANAIEKTWETNPNITFTDALDKEYKNFGVFGFSGLIEKKQKALENMYWRMIKNEMLAFFTIPKIVFTAALFYGLFQFFSNPTELVEIIWYSLKFIFIIITLALCFFQNKQFKKNKKKYLLQSISYTFYSIPCTLLIFLFSGFSNNPTIFSLFINTSFTALFVLFVFIIYIKILPLLKKEINQTNLKFQSI